MKKLTQAQKIDQIYQWCINQDQFRETTKKVLGLPFETYPTNLPVMTYVNAVKAVEAINRKLKKGEPQWHIPTLDELRLQYKHKDDIGGFITDASGSVDYPDWYWSSTEDRDNPSYVDGARFSDGSTGWYHKDFIRLSCRPVRLAAAPAL